MELSCVLWVFTSTFAKTFEKKNTFSVKSDNLKWNKFLCSHFFHLIRSKNSRLLIKLNIFFSFIKSLSHHEVLLHSTTHKIFRPCLYHHDFKWKGLRKWINKSEMWKKWWGSLHFMPNFIAMKSEIIHNSLTSNRVKISSEQMANRSKVLRCLIIIMRWWW